MSAVPGNGRSKDGKTRRDCYYAVYDGKGRVACATPEAMVLTGGWCVGRKLCVMFTDDPDGAPRLTGGCTGAVKTKGMTR